MQMAYVFQEVRKLLRLYAQKGEEKRRGPFEYKMKDFKTEKKERKKM